MRTIKFGCFIKRSSPKRDRLRVDDFWIEAEHGHLFLLHLQHEERPQIDSVQDPKAGCGQYELLEFDFP